LKDEDRVRDAAIEAVRRASVVCRAVQSQLVDASTLKKKDKSPVTVADFASQAVVCAILEQQFPSDIVVGEEDSHALRRDENRDLRGEVVEQARSVLGGDAKESDVLGWIDRGTGDARSERYWTLDPIDGTKGFLRGEQYAVALALIENGEVVFGVLGCPNLDRDGVPGSLFVASRGEGARMLDLWDDDDQRGAPIRVAQLTSASEARFCESVESGHSDQDESAEIAARLGITAEPFRIDSQCKYACVARDDASIYLRLPTRKDYREKIWDHAAGKLVVECAGGRVTDVDGRDLDFTHGRTLEQNRGIVATCGSIHDRVLEAVAAVLGG
jgi:3'(2'), 5'-bisphosphate nucleotidase